MLPVVAVTVSYNMKFQKAHTLSNILGSNVRTCSFTLYQSKVILLHAH